MKRSMYYGIRDIAKDVLNLSTSPETLRPEEFWSLDDISFEIRRGECIGVIGPNGSGKSTLLKMVNGIILPDKGSIAVRGSVGAMIEVGAGFHPLLTGKENIYLNGSILGMKKKEIDRYYSEIVDFSELGSFINSPVKFYSSGMYVRLGFAIATHLRHDILLIDEVLAVGDIGFRRKCIRRIRNFLEQGGSALFVSHDISAVRSISNSCLVLENGVQNYLGDPVEAIQKYNQATFKTIRNLDTAGHRQEKQFRFGSRRCTLDNITLTSNNENIASVLGNTNCLISGESATAVLTITAMDDIKNIAIGFTIRENDNTVLLDLNTNNIEQNISSLKKGERRTVTFNFICPLTAGSYQIGAGVVSVDDGEVLDRILDIMTLRVLSVKESSALIDIPYNAIVSQ